MPRIARIAAAMVAALLAGSCGGGGGGGGGAPPGATGTLVVLPASLSFTAADNEGNPAPRTFRVVNTGAGSMTWTATSNVSWASAIPASGACAPGQIVPVTVIIDPSAQSPGTVTGGITIDAINAGGSPKVVAVQLEVTAAVPFIALSALVLNFTATEGGANPATQTVDVLNSGVGSLGFLAIPNARWITVAPGAGTAPDTLTIGANITGLGQGIYNGFVTIWSADSPNSPARIEIFLLVTPSAGPPAGDTWTVMIYMNADNGLEPFALADINSIEAANLPATVNVIVLVDRHPGHDASNGNWTDARIYEVQPDSNPTTITSPVVSNEGEINMGDPARLRALAAFAITNYPADKYALIIWGQGAGWPAAGVDETSANPLTLVEVGTALADIQADQGGGFTFDLLVFDASLMGQLEVALEVAPYADNLVVAEEMSGGDGMDYGPSLGYLAGEPNASATALAFRFSWAYAGFFRPTDEIFATAAFDLAAVPAIETAVNALAATLDANMAVEAVNIFRTLETIEDLHEGQGTEDFIDLADFCAALAQLSANGTVQTQCAAVVNAIAAATLYADSGASRPHPIMRGLAISFPDNNDPATLAAYQAGSAFASAPSAWADMVDAYHVEIGADATDPVVSSLSLSGATVAAGGSLTGSIDVQDNIGLGEAAVFAATQSATQLTILQIARICAPIQQVLADGREADLWGAGPTTLAIDFTARAWAVSNGSSTFPTAPDFRCGQEGNPGTVMVDALYRASGTVVDVQSVMEFDAETGDLLAVFSLEVPGAIVLGVGDQVAPLALVFDTATGQFSAQTTGIFTVGATTELFLIPVALPAGSYQVGVFAEDRNGNVDAASTPVTVTAP
jgi:hypothetical protein